MSTKRLRDARRAKKRKQKLRNTLIWVGVAVIVVALGGYIVYSSTRGATGEAVEELPGRHVATGSDPGPYSSDPPTSGPHYGQPMSAGFYEDGDPETQYAYPEGYLLHSSEHGYVIFWYNCDVLESEQACTELKDDIRSVMGLALGVKLIAFPWHSLDVPVVMTSWGYMQRFEEFDKGLARTFIETNRNRAPEPNAP